MINKINKMVICLILLMIFPIIFSSINSGWFTAPSVKKNFSDTQINEICAKLKFELAHGETIHIEYFPGVLQASTYLKVFIENVKSESDFISRFHGTAVKTESDIYETDIFHLEQEPKDYHCYLRFSGENETLQAEISISGYIPDLEKIYRFSIDYFQPFLANRVFITLFIIEFFLIIYLLGQILIRFLRKQIHHAV